MAHRISLIDIMFIIFLLLIINVSYNTITGATAYSDSDKLPALDYDLETYFASEGLTSQEYINILGDELGRTESNFERAELYFILGKLIDDKEFFCKSVGFYKKYKAINDEEAAIVYETIASTGCDDSTGYYLKAAELWGKIGVAWRAELDTALAYGRDYSFKLELPEQESSRNKPQDFNTLTIGATSFKLDGSDVIVAQTERVTRDWLSGQIKKINAKNILKTFSEKLYYDEIDLLPGIGWHEGGRIRQLGITPVIASGTIFKKFNDTWYAPDENGIFRFAVTVDKAMYPTNRLLRNDLVMVIDTHGVNAIVEQAMRNDADYVIACCDTSGKIDAINYLSDRGIKSICFTDRFLYQDLMEDIEAIGSAPFKNGVIGNRPITISKDDVVIAMNASGDSQMYYDTPARYFNELSKHYKVQVRYVRITKNDQMQKVIDEANDKKSDIIAARVFSADDYIKLRSWLEEGTEHRAILFHSMPYPYGYKLLNEFPQQTGFGDIKVTAD